MSRNALEVDEAANIAVSRMLREMYDAPTHRILMLIDAGLGLEEAEALVSEELEMRRVREIGRAA